KLHIFALIGCIAIILYLVIDAIGIALDTNYLKYNRAVNITSERESSDESYVKNYENYVASHEASFPQNVDITVYGTDFVDHEGEYQIVLGHEGVDQSLLTEESGSFTYRFDIDTAGFYYVKINYFAYEGKASAIERSIKINGETPFIALENIVLHRYYGNKEDIYQDYLGNDIRPSQIEKPFWSEVYIKDSLGYIDSPFYFYFEEGANELTIESLREPLLIESFKIQSIKGYKSYETLKSEYQQNGYSFVNRDLQFIQAEDANFTTSPTLYPLNDRTSAKTMPSDPSLIKLNTIGGTNWGTAGDKISWEFEVEETGLYNISMRVKQRLATGMVVFRNIYIDDEIPFAEMENYVFSYSSDWRTQTLGTDKEAFQF